MLMTRWDPLVDVWGKLSRFQDEMNQLFDSFALDGGSWPALARAYPTVNVWEDGDHVFAEAELPGMEMSDLEMYVSGGNQLSIKGERKQPLFENATWHRQERGFGSFARVFTLPVDVEADKVEACFCNGVLTITMPKSETARPRKITVKAE